MKLVVHEGLWLNEFIMVYDDVCKVYGPYLNKVDGRKRVVLSFLNGSKKTISYPKYLMELHLNRYLQANETIDHIDGDFTNDDLSNLRILYRKEHVVLDVIRNKDLNVTCTYCTKMFTIAGSKINNRNRKNRNNSGYFCSRSCSGKFGKDIQLNKIQSVKIDKIKPDKFKIKFEQFGRNPMSECESIGKILTGDADDNSEANPL